MTPDPIIADCLAQIARISAKYRNDIDAIAPMRVSQLKAMAGEIETLTDRVARCTCQEPAGFEIDVRRHSRPLDAQFMLARLKRMRGEDARGVG